jgi:hypothetical protein
MVVVGIYTIFSHRQLRVQILCLNGTDYTQCSRLNTIHHVIQILLCDTHSMKHLLYHSQHILSIIVYRLLHLILPITY